MITTNRIKLIACCISVVIACSCAAVAADSENYNEGVFTEMVNPEIPMKASLAGETVNLDRIDMAERLDRELTSIVYGHSNTSLVLKRANRYFPMIAPILEQNGVPVDLSLIHI